MVKGVAVETLLQVFHQVLPGHADALGGAGGAGGILQIDKLVCPGRRDHIGAAVGQQPVGIDTFQTDRIPESLFQKAAGDTDAGSLFQGIVGDQGSGMAGL